MEARRGRLAGIVTDADAAHVALQQAVADHRRPETVIVRWTGGRPASDQVLVTPSMSAWASVTSKTATGFSVVLNNGGTILCRHDRLPRHQHLTS